MKLSKGFTLIEVMVALFVLVLGLAAVLESTSTSNRALSQQRDRMLAQWVAMNQLSETRVSGQWPKNSNLSGESTMAGHIWRWQQQTSTTEDPNLRRIEVRVFRPGEEQSLAFLVGFMGKP